MGEAKQRYLYLDNLRLLMIVFVVIMHLAVTYSGIGSWYYMDTHELDALSMIFFGIYQSFTQAYFMGFLFLISGYFVARSYDKKGSKKFICDRLIRLGIPTLIYMLVIHPFCVYVLLGFQWERHGFFDYYFDYLTSFDFIGSSGPLWFAFALLLFNCVYVLIRIATQKRVVKKEMKFPSTGALLIFIGLIAIITYLVRLVQPIGTNVANMQLCFFTQYILMFIAGVKAGRYDWFSKISYKSGRRWLTAALVLGIILWGVVMVTGKALMNGLDDYVGGLTWQSLVYALWESFVAVAMSVGLLGVFREKCNAQSGIMSKLSDSSFAVYVFHAPIIIGLSLLITDLKIPLIPKFLLACIIALPLCFAAAYYIFKRIPLLKKAL